MLFSIENKENFSLNKKKFWNNEIREQNWNDNYTIGEMRGLCKC